MDRAIVFFGFLFTLITLGVLIAIAWEVLTGGKEE